MIWLASFVTDVAFELPVIVQTVPCVSDNALVLPAGVVTTPCRIELRALYVVFPPLPVCSNVLLLATAVVLVKSIFAIAPWTENEAPLAWIVAPR